MGSAFFFYAPPHVKTPSTSTIHRLVMSPQDREQYRVSHKRIDASTTEIILVSIAVPTRSVGIGSTSGPANHGEYHGTSRQHDLNQRRTLLYEHISHISDP